MPPATSQSANAPIAEALAPAITRPVDIIDEHLRSLVQSLPAPENLRDAIAYGLYGGGKRLRPLLSWWCCCAAKGDTSDAAGKLSLPSGAAVELVHAFSLVHDDLPAMDDDDMRRGRPTLHKATTEAMAILAGDAMLNLAYGHLAQSISIPSLLSALVLELAHGTSGMIAGQVYDTLGGFPAALNPEQKLMTIHTNKTGALLRASCRMGALGAMGDKPNHTTLEAITTYADAVGLMFQIVDDIIDVTQPPEHAGKMTGKDIDAGKLTYPGVLGIPASRQRVTRLLDESLSALRPLGPSAEPLRAIASYMAVRTK